MASSKAEAAMNAFTAKECPLNDGGELEPYHGQVTHYPGTWPWQCNTCGRIWRIDVRTNDLAAPQNHQ